MIDFYETFLHNDQPMTCPYCGASTTFYTTTNPNDGSEVEIHKCIASNCHFEFIAEEDEDFMRQQEGLLCPKCDGICLYHGTSTTTDDKYLEIYICLEENCQFELLHEA